LFDFFAKFVFEFILLILGLGFVAILWQLEAFDAPNVASAKKLLRMRGLVDVRPLPERVGARVPLFQKILVNANISRLLAVAGKNQTVGQWVTGMAGVTFLVIVALSLVYIVTQFVLGSPMYPFFLIPIGGGVTVILYVFSLRSAARKRQQGIGIELGDILVSLGVLTGPAGMPIEDSLLTMSKCTKEQYLYQLLKDRSWEYRIDNPRGLVKSKPRTQFQAFAAIAKEYDLPLFKALSGTVRSTTVKGLNPLLQYTNLAKSVYESRLGEAKVEAAKAKIKLTIPVAGMILPLMILLTAPLVYAIVKGLSG
jgi:hypothetical protein